MHIAPRRFLLPSTGLLIAASLTGALILIAAQCAAALQPPVVPSLDALRARVDAEWTNSVSAATLPPGAPFVHDLGVLAYGTAFPTTLFDGCGAVTNEGVVMYSLTVMESNDVTRVWVCPGGEVERFSVPANYNAQEWAINHFPPPTYLTSSERSARIAEAKLGGRQTLRMRLISESSIPAYLASLAARASAGVTSHGTNEIGVVTSRLMAGGGEIEVLVDSPTEVGLIGIYKTTELSAPPDWTFQGFAVRMDSPMSFHLPAAPKRAYMLFANHLRDTDGDRIPDAYEELITGTNVNSQDTDGDGLDDWEEASLYKTSGKVMDTDGDGISDFMEVTHGLDPTYNPGNLLDSDGDGFPNDMEARIGTNPTQFNQAPAAGLYLEQAIREVKMNKFGFRAFAPCYTACERIPETFYLRSRFNESGYTRCPGGTTRNHACEATVEYNHFGNRVIQDGCPIPPPSSQYPFYWYRGPDTPDFVNFCEATNLTEVLMEGDLHYAGQYYREPPLCDSPLKLDYFEFKQMLDKPFTDDLLETWAELHLRGLNWPAYGATNQVQVSGDVFPRQVNPTDLEFAYYETSVWADLCGIYNATSLTEHESSVASRWYQKGYQANSKESLSLRTSRMRLASSTGPGTTAPGLRSLTCVELHAPEGMGAGSGYFLVGRRAVKTANTFYLHEPGRIRDEEWEFTPPAKPGQVLVIQDPVEVTPLTPSLLPDSDIYVRAMSRLSSAFRITPHDLFLPAGRLGWRSVPDVGLELRQVLGPGSSIVEDVNGALAPMTGPSSGQYRYDLGAAADFTDTRTLFLSFPTNGLYVFHVALSGPNVGGERVMARWAVNVLDVKMGVDANRDGQIKFGVNWQNAGPADLAMDETTQTSPFRFWVNNDADDTERKEGGSHSNPAPDWQDMTINGARDLEDFMRIHINLGELWDEIELGKVLVGFKWHSITGTPALNLFDHIDPEGGTRYLTDLSMGTVQAMSIAPIVQPTRSIASKDGTRRKIDDTAGAFILPNTFWEGVNSGKSLRHLLFEACGEGAGAFTLTFHSPNGTWLGDGPQVWLKFIDIEKLYIRSDGAKTIQDPPPDLTDETIVFVHGWNMSPGEKTYFAETFYKRLWHRGYRGCFASFMWETFHSPAEYWAPGALGSVIEAALAKYNDSEFIAWNSAAALKTFVNDVPGRHKNLAAHSMGNIVAGEALRLGLVVDNYALMQSAVPAACYDADDTNVKEMLPYNIYGAVSMWDKDTPDDDTDPATRQLAYRGRFANIAQNVRLTSFFMPNDYATFKPFEFNNDQYKPELGEFSREYHYKKENPGGQKLYKYRYLSLDPNVPGVEVLDYYLSNPYEAMSFACSTYGKALGAQNKARGAINPGKSIALNRSRFQLFHQPGGTGFNDQHSGQFLATIQELRQFYFELLNELNIKGIQ